MTTANNAGALNDAGIAEDTMVDLERTAEAETESAKTRVIFGVDEYLRHLEPEIRYDIYQQIVTNVVEEHLPGVIRVESIYVEMWNTNRNSRPKLRRVRQVLLQNDSVTIAALEAIEADVRLQTQLRMASRLPLETVAELAASGNFGEMAALSSRKQQQVQRHRHAAKEKRAAKTKTKKKKQP